MHPRTIFFMFSSKYHLQSLQKFSCISGNNFYLCHTRCFSFLSPRALFNHIQSMKDRLTVKIAMEPYLQAFLICVYRQQPPLFFPKRDRLNDLLQILLAKPPKDHKPRPSERDHLEVIIPYFENLNIMSYHYLSIRNQVIFSKKVKQMFNCTYIDFMEKCFMNDISKNDAIALFLEKYDIPVDDKIEDMLRKQLYRSKRITRKYPIRDYRKTARSRNIMSDSTRPSSHCVTNADI